MRREQGLVGKESEEGELTLAPEVAEEARRVREQGFMGASQRSEDKKRPTWYPPWDKTTYRQRAGESLDPYEFMTLVDLLDLTNT